MPDQIDYRVHSYPPCYPNFELHPLRVWCHSQAKVCSHACMAIDWTMPVLSASSQQQMQQGAHLTDHPAVKERLGWLLKYYHR